MSEKVFKWSDDDHEKAAQYAEQRANELKQQQAGPRLAKSDLSGHIQALEDTAKYHRSKLSTTTRPTYGQRIAGNK